MNQKILLILGVFSGFIVMSCNSGTKPADESTQKIESRQDSVTSKDKKTDTVVISQGTNSKGIGRFKEIQLTHPLEEAMAAKGEAIYNAKCIACHKLTTEKLVGPGWKNVTDRRKPEWIMNFITNTQVMLDKDLVAQSEMVTCIVRMPNQDLTDAEARQVLEYMRKNDGKK